MRLLQLAAAVQLQRRNRPYGPEVAGPDPVEQQLQFAPGFRPDLPRGLP